VAKGAANAVLPKGVEHVKPVIGLIGGIGSGKSAAAAAFARRGGRILVADEFGHEALDQPENKARIVEQFGKGIVDEKGAIVRQKLGAIVFADAEKRRKLEATVHPWIERRIEEEIARAQADPTVRFVVLDAALMLETGWSRVCSKLVFVQTPREARLERIAQQRGWTPQEVEAREHAQLPLTEKARRADHVLDNSTTLDALDRQVDDLLQVWGLASLV
jgi:dephospho-CoA kinase